MKKILLRIDGMTCSACSNGLEKFLNKQNGIYDASVNLVMANALINYDETLLNQEKIEKYILKAGFKSLGIYNERSILNSNKNKKTNLYIFSFLAILLMYVSMGMMVHLPVPSFINMSINPINYSICLLILTIPFLIYGLDILKSGINNLIHKSPNMDSLVTIGVISSFLYSLYNMFLILGGDHSLVHHLYFESSAIVIYFIKLGRYVDSVNKDKTKEAIEKLVMITPTKATIKVDGKLKEVTIDEIKKGNIVVSKPGERISVDGEIISGKAHLDESFITGESKPVLKDVGGSVIAGSINYDGYLEYKAVRIGRESTISSIVRLVVEATNTKAPIAKMSDKVSGIFTPTVIILAIVTFIIYLLCGSSFGESLNTFVSILVVACPCSLGLATPLAIIISEGVCAKKGILVKKSEILENASKIDTVVFDKTGTLTYGKLKISKIYNYSDLSDDELLRVTSSLEDKSTHPIANAFKDYACSNDLDYYEVDHFLELSGLGISGMIEKDKYLVGNSKILDKYSIKNKYVKDEKKLARDGNSIIYVVRNDTIIGLIGVNDIIRDNIGEVISGFKSNGIDVIMLTGDNSETANTIAKSIGITSVIASVVPSEKSSIINDLKSKGKFVLMCGDGINDSPALASSDIGVSVHSGTDIAKDSADVILINNDISNILSLIEISKKTIRNIKQNLFWAFFYNALMIPIAMGLLKPFGISINPMFGSFAMMFSSFTVIINALRLRKN